MKIFRLPIVFFILIFAAAGSFAQTGVLRTERSQSSVVTFVEGADIIGLSSSHFIDGYVRRYGKDRFIFPVGHGITAGPFAGDGSGIIGAYYAENPGASTLAGGPFTVTAKAAEIQTVSSVEYWHIDGAEPTTLSFTWNTNSGIAGLTGNALNKLSVVGWSSANKRWEVIPSQVDAVALLGGNSTLTSGSISTARAIIPDQYDVFTLAGLTSGAAPSDYAGKLETADCRAISGWVYDKNNSASEVVVELVDGTKVYGQAIASNFRADLKANGIGTGKYGFSIPLPEDARDGNYRNLSVRVRGTNFSLEGSPKIVGCGYRGKFESADCYTVKGWTVIGEYPDSSLVVDLLADGQFQGSYAANIYRSDVQPLVGGSGKVGFEFQLPSSVKTNTPRQLSLRAKDSKFVLDDSPKTVQCAEPQTFGSFEVANCSALTGWVWDKIYPANALTVEILEGNAVVATGLANIYRADLKAGGFGTGNYAFSIPYPEALKDGRTHQLTARVKGSNYMLVGNRTVNCLLEIYGGAFETAECNAIRGWAWDKNHPDVPMTVELLADGAVVATSVANSYREDLKNAGTGTGNYGFSIPVPNNLKDAQPHSYSVRIQGTTYVLGGSPRTMTCAVPSQYGGGFETANCSALTGWVWDKIYPESALTVEILEGTTVVATGLANIYRADLKAAGYGTGNYVFSIPLPDSLKDGVSHQLSVRVKGSTYMVGGTTKTVNCLLQVYNGAFESADCNTLRGWAWDKSHPNAAMTVELLADGAVVATTVANTYREDLKTAGTGTGNYGFSIPVPNNLKDAQAHSYSVRIQGTTYVLGGSPRTMTCALPSQYGGGFETANCSVITGWVWDKTYPANALTVEILEAGAVVATGVANIYRADLKSAGYGTGNYAFNIPLPEALKDGVSHQLSVRVKGSTYMVGSAKTVSCASPARRSSSGYLPSYRNDAQQSLNEDVRGINLTIYPNPTKGKVIAQFHLGIDKIAQISITNLLGRQLWFKSVKGVGENVEVGIQLADYPDGLYIVQLVVDGQTQLQRILLTR
ncbi:MAG: hypothetical protein BGO21_30415 [Dyadobacter sp. 50-39]|uniref:T9SS type A sorting domain-containing protein n=1 Tax=Dyadobacter sp. 50-39 TaxID=1895756 RepID=UPI00096444A7|nr:T9SS type A sorting domain-containing protein [Dyadobacter sp. 50-39]OJV15890.1 MAG: hypothetical protein BGO21_30415 [Dyadobacter sp. 50-39]